MYQGYDPMCGQQQQLNAFGYASSLSSLFGETGLLTVGQYLSTALNPRQMDENDWHEYQYSFPPNNILLQFERRQYTSQSAYPQITSWIGYADFDPAFNISYLYWRYTGIGKHQIDDIRRRNMPVSHAAVTTSASLPNTTAIYYGKPKKVKKKPAKRKSK
jgi:hypothetical protein